MTSARRRTGDQKLAGVLQSHGHGLKQHVQQEDTRRNSGRWLVDAGIPPPPISATRLTFMSQRPNPAGFSGRMAVRPRARCACSRALRILHIIAADYFFRWPPQRIFSSFGRQGALACRPIGGQVKRLGLSSCCCGAVRPRARVGRSKTGRDYGRLERDRAELRAAELKTAVLA